MNAIDTNAAALGLSQRILMESSGNALASAVKDMATPGDHICLVCGTGNNGGDAFVAARFLTDYTVSILLIGRPRDINTTIATHNWELLKETDVDRRTVTDSSDFSLPHCDLIVDAICGTGITGALREPAATAVREINASSVPVVATDIPSGLNANTGEVTGPVIEADQVVSFHALKPGLSDLDCPVTVADIGIPVAAERFVGPGDITPLSRQTDAHKGDAGKILVIGGGPYIGAPALSGLAALRMGADLVTIATPESAAATVQGYAPDLLVEPLPGDKITAQHSHALEKLATAADCLVVGPGIGRATETFHAVTDLLESYAGRAVVDAEAIDTLSQVSTSANMICTPHAGEFSRIGEELPADTADRVVTVQGLAASIDQTVVLKGAIDIISDGSHNRLNRTGNPGMTVGGTGDVLAGVIGALFADQERTAFEAACMGTYLSGKAGDRMFEHNGNGLLASDVLEALPVVVRGNTHD